MNSPLEILKKYWGYSNFRSIQEVIINTVLEKKNTVVLLPTGGGKSICYQIPAILSEGVCIVISPLIALINDQVNSIEKKGIKAIALTSQLSQNDVITAFDNLMYGNYKFLYLSPEKFQSKLIQEKIKQLNVSIIAIDEAHCISEWGHDFRPSDLKLKELKSLQPKATVITLTATATSRVLKDIQTNLEIENAIVFKQSFKRTNLSYHVIHTEDIYGRLKQIATKINEPLIIYTNNRKQTKEVSQFLNRNNFKSSFYHGGLSVSEKNSAFENWINEATPIMVATNAFGMGIDKENVRAVIHINIPNSIENFIQEAGRAGRDQKTAYSITLTNEALLSNSISKFAINTPTIDKVKNVYHHLNQYFNVSLGEIPTEIFNFSLQEFCDTYQLNVLATYTIIKILEREGIVSLDENFSKKSTVKFLINNNQLFNFLEKNTKQNNLINLILRSYGGIFEHYTVINETFLSKKLTISKKEIIQQLQFLNNDGIIAYNCENTGSKLTFLIAREDVFTINKIKKNIEQQNSRKTNKLTAVIHYLKNNTLCRNIQLLNYFNEDLNNPCGTCDVCIRKQKNKHSNTSLFLVILELLKNNSLTSREITSQLQYSEEEILNSLKILLEKNKITLTSQNKFKLN